MPGLEDSLFVRVLLVSSEIYVDLFFACNCVKNSIRKFLFWWIRKKKEYWKKLNTWLGKKSMWRLVFFSLQWESWFISLGWASLPFLVSLKQGEDVRDVRNQQTCRRRSSGKPWCYHGDHDDATLLNLAPPFSASLAVGLHHHEDVFGRKGLNSKRILAYSISFNAHKVLYPITSRKPSHIRMN